MTFLTPLPRPLLALLSALYLLLGSIGTSWAEASPDDVARQIKAAYLVKFANYIEWPPGSFEGPESPIVIGVIGADRLADELQRITHDRQVGKRPVAVRRLTTSDTSARVHILYMGTRAGDRLKSWFQSVEGQPMLSVTDSTHDLAHASAIKFVIDKNRVRFDVSVPAAERSGIKITALLLTVARELEH
jgi:hypothetical protein